MGTLEEKEFKLSRQFPPDIGGSNWSYTDEWFIEMVGVRAHDEWIDTLEWGGAMLDCSYMNYLWNAGDVYLRCDRDGMHRQECWRETPGISKYVPTDYPIVGF